MVFEGSQPLNPTAEGRLAFGRLIRELRGDRLQVEVLRAVNEHLEAAGETARVSQGQYSAYEHGRERPNPIRLGAIASVLGVQEDTLTAVLDVQMRNASRATPSGRTTGA